MGCLVGTGFLLCWEGGEEVHLIISNNLILLKYSHQRSFVSVFFKLNFSLIYFVLILDKTFRWLVYKIITLAMLMNNSS